MTLPLLDEHTVTLRASQSAAWRAVRKYGYDLAQADHLVLDRVLGAEPRSGFELTEEVEGERLALSGRHRFARYRLVFELETGPNNVTKLSVLSFAAFPGTRGRFYRGLLMRSGGHLLAVRHMLRTIQRQAA